MNVFLLLTFHNHLDTSGHHTIHKELKRIDGLLSHGGENRAEVISAGMVSNHHCRVGDDLTADEEVIHRGLFVRHIETGQRIFLQLAQLGMKEKLKTSCLDESELFIYLFIYLFNQSINIHQQKSE